MRTSMLLLSVTLVACASGPTAPTSSSPSALKSDSGKSGSSRRRSRQRRRRARPDDPPLYGDVATARFARTESAHFVTMDPLLRSCTIQQQALAGAAWITIVTGQEAKDKSGAAALKLAQTALEVARGQPMGRNDLATVAWYVAEALRRQLRSPYRYDRSRGEIVVGRGLRPLQAVLDAHAGRRSLDQLWQEARRAPRGAAGEPSCSGVQPADLSRLRARPPRR